MSLYVCVCVSFLSLSLSLSWGTALKLCINDRSLNSRCGRLVALLVLCSAFGATILPAFEAHVVVRLPSRFTTLTGCAGMSTHSARI